MLQREWVEAHKYQWNPKQLGRDEIVGVGGAKVVIDMVYIGLRFPENEYLGVVAGVYRKDGEANSLLGLDILDN